MDKNISLEDLDIELKNDFKKVVYAACAEAFLVDKIITAANTDSTSNIVYHGAFGVGLILGATIYRAGRTALQRHRINNHIERMFP